MIYIVEVEIKIRGDFYYLIVTFSIKIRSQKAEEFNLLGF